MTDRLRLDSLGISGLRSIGWHPDGASDDSMFQVLLDDIPEVAIIAGPNGLGKSTIVSGLRLALTGRLPGRRGMPLPFDVLRCQTGGGEGGPSRVHASFATGEGALELGWEASSQQDADLEHERILKRIKALSVDEGLMIPHIFPPELAA